MQVSIIRAARDERTTLSTAVRRYVREVERPTASGFVDWYLAMYPTTVLTWTAISDGYFEAIRAGNAPMPVLV